MSFLKQLPWIVIVVFLLIERIASPSAEGQGTTELEKLHRLEIVDDHGNVRITMTTDNDGSAVLSFRAPNAPSPSVLSQGSDGTMTLRFAGKKGEPAIVLRSDPHYGGPSLLLTGNTWPEQRILLGFHVDDAPSESSRVWGLFLPTPDGFHNFSAVAAARNSKTGQTTGFVIPEAK
jgi:hypothetical protein